MPAPAAINRPGERNQASAGKETRRPGAPAADTHYLRVSVDVTPREARITFADNGIGIKPEYADRVFEMFYRATENTDGSGLGLYIVRQIVDKMKGTIRLESQYGRGTTLRVTLPNESAASGSGDQPPYGVPGNQ